MVQQKSESIFEKLNEICSEGRAEAERTRSSQLSESYRNRFLSAVDEFDALWDQLADVARVQSYPSDGTAYLEAAATQDLAMNEACAMARYFGLAIPLPSATEFARSCMETEAELAKLRMASVVGVGDALQVPIPQGAPLATEAVHSTATDPNFIAWDKKSVAISTDLKNEMAKVSGVNSLSDEQCDSIILPYIRQHRALRRQLGRADDPGFDLIDYGRMNIGIRHAGDTAVYLAYRLDDNAWLQKKVALLELEAKGQQVMLDLLKWMEAVQR